MKKSSLVIVVEVEHEEDDGDLRGFTNETTATIAAAVFKKPHTVVSSKWEFKEPTWCSGDYNCEEINCTEHGDPQPMPKPAAPR